MEKVSLTQRDIVLVPFPFSDRSGEKIRPALVLSNNHFNQGEDIIICGITSSLKATKYALIIEQSDLEGGFLYEKSLVKVENLLKIKKSFILKTIGKLDKKTFFKVLTLFHEIFKQ